MDYFSTFIQMLHAKKLSQNTIRVYVSPESVKFIAP